jgi:hypothetical protein
MMPQGTYVKHQMSELRDMLVKADIDESRREVTLHVPHIDSALIITYALRSLAHFGVQVVQDDNDKDESWRTPLAPYKLYIECFGTLHCARVVRLYGSEVLTLVLETPAKQHCAAPRSAA